MTIQQEVKSGAILRALSWKEPYATMMLHGKIETRSWNTNYRGLVLICASKKKYDHGQVDRISGWHHWDRMLTRLLDGETDYMETLGHAIAIGRLVDSRPMTLKDETKAFVTFHPELWCHVYEDVVPIVPIPWKGKQGWSTVNQEFINQIKFK